MTRREITWKRLDNALTDKAAIAEGEKLRDPRFNSIVYQESDAERGIPFRTVKEWKAIE